MIVLRKPTDRFSHHRSVSEQFEKRGSKFGRASTQKGTERLTTRLRVCVGIVDDLRQFDDGSAITEDQTQALYVPHKILRIAFFESFYERTPVGRRCCLLPTVERLGHSHHDLLRKREFFALGFGQQWNHHFWSGFDFQCQSASNVLRQSRDRRVFGERNRLCGIARYCRFYSIPKHRRKHAILTQFRFRCEPHRDRPSIGV